MRLPFHALDRTTEELKRSAFLRIFTLIALLALVVTGLDTLANFVPIQ